ncbi:hypothetical protein D3C85_1474050 [compost metagenome]
MSAGIGAKNVDGIDGVQIIFTHLGAKYINYPWVESYGQNRCQAFLPKLFAQCQFVGVPRWWHVEVAGCFEYGRVYIVRVRF